MANYTKYKYYKKQIYSGGTWIDVEPLVLTLSGEPYGNYTTYEECMGITPPTPVPTKLKLTYSGYPEKIINCNNTETVSAIVHPTASDSYTALTTAEIGECVTDISGGFQNCSNLLSVTIPQTVTNIDGAFFNCGNLKSVVIPSGVTTIGSATFSGCTKLSSIVIPNSVISIGDSAFDSCNRLASITIPDSVTSIGNYAFRYCDGLTSLVIPSGVTTIGYSAFRHCLNLLSITVNAANPPTLGSRAFDNTDNCPIYVHCNSVSAYKSASGWSDYASRIFGYDCPTQYRWVESGTTCIGVDKWQRSIKQQSTNGGSTWTNVYPVEYSATTLIEANSVDCGYVPGPKITLTNSGGTTYSAVCNSSTTLSSGETRPLGFSYVVAAEIGDCVTTIGNRAFYSFTSLSSVTIPNSVTSIGTDAFRDCKRLSSITIPDSVTYIGSGALWNCDGLTSLVIPSGVTSIGNSAIRDNGGLTSITISNSVTTIGISAFEYCTKLTNITIPDSVTSISNWAFYGCSGLTGITVNAVTPPILDTSAIGETKYTFDNTNNCPIYVPINSVNAYKTAWSDYADRIQAIVPIPSGTTKFKATYSGGTTYSAECSSLSELTGTDTRPSGYQYSAMTSAEIGECVISIGDSAFYNCSSLISVTIGNRVASIGSSAFYNCSSLTGITIPSSVTSIGDNAFRNCEGLSSITCLATTPPSLGSRYTLLTYNYNMVIYVPASSVNAYKSATYWSEYADRIQAIT